MQSRRTSAVNGATSGSAINSLLFAKKKRASGYSQAGLATGASGLAGTRVGAGGTGTGTSSRGAASSTNRSPVQQRHQPQPQSSAIAPIPPCSQHEQEPYTGDHSQIDEYESTMYDDPLNAQQQQRATGALQQDHTQVSGALKTRSRLPSKDIIRGSITGYSFSSS